MTNILKLKIPHVTHNKYTILVFTLIFTAFLFLPNFNSEFLHWDDEWLIIENKYVHNFSASNLLTILFSVDPYERETLGGEYLPVRDFVTLAIYSIFGPNAIAFKFINLILYLLSLVVFYKILLLLPLNKEIAKAGFVLYAILPVHIEAVSWITEIKELLALLFFFLSFYCYAREKKYYLVLSALFYFLSVFSKSPYIVLPLVIFIYDIFFKRVKVLNYIPFIIILFFSFSIHLFIAKNTSFYDKHIGGSLYYNVLSMFVIIVKYLYNTFLPFNLSPLYNEIVVTSFFDLRFLISLLFILSIITIALFAFVTKKNKTLLFFLIFSIVTFMPFSQIIPFGTATKIADRYLILPSIGFIFFPLIVANEYFRKINKKIIYTFFVMYTLILSYFTLQRKEVWTNTPNLWENVIKKNKNNYFPYYSLGDYYFEKGDYEKAAKLLGHATTLDQSNVNVFHQLGISFIKLKEYRNAAYILEIAHKMDNRNKSILYNLALSNFYEKKYSKALPIITKYLKLFNDCPNGWDLMGAIYTNLGDPVKGFCAHKRALSIKSDFIQAKQNLDFLINKSKLKNIKCE